MRTIFACGLAVALVVGCRNEWKPAAVPAALAGMRVYVAPTKVEATDSDCRPDALNAWTTPQLTDALIRWGYSVVTRPEAADVTLTPVLAVSDCWASDSTPKSGEMRVTVESTDGVLFAGHSGGINSSDVVDFAPRLIDAISQSPRMAQFAANRGAAKANVATSAPSSPAATTAAAAPPPAETPAPAAPAVAAAQAPSFVGGAAQRNAFALVVGIEKYRDVPAPPGARHDAETFKSLATKTLGVPEGNVRYLSDDRASKTDLEREIAWLKANVPQDGKVFFFFAGHGAPDAANGTSYLLPYDGLPDAITQTGIPLATVLRGLGETKATQVVAFVDACFSGAGGRSVLPKGARPLVRVKETPTAARVAVFSAAGASQISGPTADGSGGLFTTTLAEGLGRGYADIDGDGAITLDELSQWVSPRVTREAQRQSREQKPALTVPANAAPSGFALASGISR